MSIQTPRRYYGDIHYIRVRPPPLISFKGFTAKCQVPLAVPLLANLKMASCKTETAAYRQCLKDSKTSGCSASKKCKRLAISLETCRERWRKANDVVHQFDGTRILPNAKCKPLNANVQNCIQRMKGDQSKCSPEIEALKTCMAKEKGVYAAPTEGDKVWSDYKGPK